MIQELFGENASGPLNHSSSTNTTTTISTNTTTTTTSDPPKLRCPRCDSSQTKFCYYNNYNLTQPRHFCKTCRRYWTKGGALRNVPIGGGCRKNKATNIATVIGKSISNTGRFKAAVSSELGKSSFLNAFELESNPNSNPIMWSGPPQTSHLLSLFRATTQNPNPNNNFTPNSVSHMKDQRYVVAPNMGSLGFESLSNSLWRNNQQDHQNMNQHDQIMTTDQRLRSYYHHDESGPLILSSNVANTSSSASSSTILDSSPVFTSGELGFWNQTLPWSDLAAANGAYP